MAVDHDPAGTPKASSRNTRSPSAHAGSAGSSSSSAANSMPVAWRASLGQTHPGSRPDPGPLERWSRAAGYRLTELLNVCAAYLGIAVLVAVAMVFTIAPLREEMSEIHYTLMSALRSESAGSVLHAMLAVGENDPGAAMNAGAPGFPPPRTGNVGADLNAPDGGAGDLRSADKTANFAQLLQKSIDESRVAGITPAQERALRSYIARKYRVASSVVGALISTAFVVAREMNLDPQLILAVIAIESRYNPYAESHVGAQGLMQVLTRVHVDKFTEFDEGSIAALHPIANVRVGSRILRDCIDRRGSVERGLACYVGATGPSDGGYGAKVLAERRRMALASGIPVGR